MVFVHYYVTYRYIVQNHEHLDNLAFAKQNIPGSDNFAPGIVILFNTWSSCRVLRHKRLYFVNRERTAFSNLFYVGFAVCY